MELRRLDNDLVWQSGFRCPCPDCGDLTNVIDLGQISRGYILKGSLGLPTMPMENYPETCLFCMYGLWYIAERPARGASRVSNYGLECDVIMERRTFVKWNAF